VETIPGETLAKIGLEEDPSTQGSYSRRAPPIMRISFSDKSVLSSIIPTFSPRLPKSRNVKTFSYKESLKKPSAQGLKCGQTHPGYLDRFGFVFSLQVLAEARNQREVKNDE
jgi:hypothetical protein